MRWLIALVVSFAVAAPADAGVFKSRGKPDKPAPAKKAAPAKKPATKAAPRKAPATSRAPAKKKGRSLAAKKQDEAPKITVEEEDDVIIRDIDD